MVHTNLTITGDIGEVVQTIRQLATPRPAAAHTPAIIAPPPISPAPTPEPPGETPPPPVRVQDEPIPESAAAPAPSWTTETAATLLTGITEHAAQIIRYLAEHDPPEAAAAQVRAHLELDPNQVRSARISAGNRARRSGLPTPAIAGRGDTLSIHPDLAQAIRSVLDQHSPSETGQSPPPTVRRRPAAPRLDRRIWGLQPRADADTGQQPDTPS